MCVSPFILFYCLSVSWAYYCYSIIQLQKLLVLPSLYLHSKCLSWLFVFVHFTLIQVLFVS